jgi:hypothetical protein
MLVLLNMVIVVLKETSRKYDINYIWEKSESNNYAMIYAKQHNNFCITIINVKRIDGSYLEHQKASNSF